MKKLERKEKITYSLTNTKHTNKQTTNKLTNLDLTNV